MADAKNQQAPGWGTPSADAENQETIVPSELISRDELKKVIAERDAYKRRLRQTTQQQQADDDRQPFIENQTVSSEQNQALKKQLAEKDRTIARLLIDNEIASCAARQGAFDPQAVVKLTHDFFTVKDNRVQLADNLEDSGLSRFDDAGNERPLSAVVGQYLSQNEYLLRAHGAQGAGSRNRSTNPLVSIQGLNSERYASLSPAEKDAVRRLAGVPGRTKVW